MGEDEEEEEEDEEEEEEDEEEEEEEDVEGDSNLFGCQSCHFLLPLSCMTTLQPYAS